MGKIKAIIKRPYEPVGRMTEVSNTLEELQQIVGGYIETVTFADDMVIICDEEGRLKRRPYNCSPANIVDLFGTIIVVGTKGEEFADVGISLETWEQLLG